jgi:structural maintenance of chromosomes protein 5
MDPRNERMVFELLSRAARGLVGADALAANATSNQKALPQYFLITPKLLPNLPFTEDMTVLCVFNGPEMVRRYFLLISSFS